MKQSTVKTLGVAALGAFLAAAGAGAAQAAAPAAREVPQPATSGAREVPPPDPALSLRSLTQRVPRAQNALGNTLRPTTQIATNALEGTGPVRQAGQLVGGLPADQLNKAAALGALPTRALPLGR
ncbi:ATP-binding protein [Streptomyces sp. TS71-3]|uniref:ATP-binding protein n=1 Tax=Streptomyces sp. TS71-3 TaxID=2733862 RepID=UPI001B241653|nr:ATP-binding protein [Streptomyces sp. TS71-3]GHJ35224.1 hypothetical protein Sm713_08330 [Streptomyces sp. TS71-3]